MSDDHITQLHLIQQNLQHVVVQKQQLQRNIAETESALKELKETKNAYKILGGIMVEAKKEELQKELEEKKDTFSLRIKTLDKQEDMLQKKTEELQKEMIKND